MFGLCSRTYHVWATSILVLAAFYVRMAFYKKLKNFSCEYDRVNG